MRCGAGRDAGAGELGAAAPSGVSPGPPQPPAGAAERGPRSQPQPCPARLSPVPAAGSRARCAAEPRCAGLTVERCSAPGDKWTDSVNYDSSILGRAGFRSVSACPIRLAGRVAGGLCGFVTTVQPCPVHKPHIRYTLDPS